MTDPLTESQQRFGQVVNQSRPPDAVGEGATQIYVEPDPHELVVDPARVTTLDRIWAKHLRGRSRRELSANRETSALATPSTTQGSHNATVAGASDLFRRQAPHAGGLSDAAPFCYP